MIRARFPKLPAPLPVGGNAEDFGEAVRALAPQHRTFVIAYVDGASVSDAAKAAGYTRTWGSQLLRRDDVGTALQELGRTLLRGEGARSIRTMIDLRDDPHVPPPTRLRAAEAIADRSGFHVVTESHEHHHVHMTEAEVDKRILALAAELGMSSEDAQRMLIAPADFRQNADTGVFEIAPAEPVDIKPMVVDEPDVDHEVSTDQLGGCAQRDAAEQHQPHWGQLRRPNPNRVAQNMRRYRERLKAMSPEERAQRQLLRKAARDLSVTQPPATIDNDE